MYRAPVTFPQGVIVAAGMRRRAKSDAVSVYARSAKFQQMRSSGQKTPSYELDNERNNHDFEVI